MLLQDEVVETATVTHAAKYQLWILVYFFYEIRSCSSNLSLMYFTPIYAVNVSKTLNPSQVGYIICKVKEQCEQMFQYIL